MTDPSETALIDAIEGNHTDYWLHYGRGPGGEVHDGPELVWFTTGIVHPLFNGVMRARLAPPDLPAKIDAIVAEFRRRGIPLEWAVGASSAPRDLGRYLERQGLKHSHDYPGMAVALERLPSEEAPPDGISIDPVRGRSDLEACLRVAVAAFGVPSDVVPRLVEIEARGTRKTGTVVRHFLGRLDGRPVASAMLFATRGVAGLYLVGTLPDVRGRGIARAMTLAALHAGHELGHRIGVLQATEQGLPVYRRLGFREYYTIELYSLDDEGLPKPGTTATL